MVPGQIFLLPQYQLIQKMGLLNTIPALFLPNLFSAFGTFLLRQFFMSMPQELEDAAIVDGCNRFQIFGRIMVPLIQPGIAALTIFTFKFAWNDFMWPLIVNNSMDKLILRPCTVHSAGSVHDTVPDADGRRRISRYPAGCNLLHLPEAVYRKRGHIRHQGLNPYRTSLCQLPTT